MKLLRPGRTLLGAALLTLATPPAGAASGEATGREADPWFRGGREAVVRARARLPEQPVARNVVLFLGDGMGLSTVTAARILAGQQAGRPGEEHELAFETLPHVALLKTYNTNQMVPDSAGTMTALMSGVKTKAGVLGVDDRVRPGDHTSVPEARVPTLLEEAEQRGLATGIVTTARITHATPAAGYAHSPSRRWECDADLSPAALRDDFPDIARQLVEFPVGDGLDVVLGGGRSYFLPANARDPEEAEGSGRRWDERNLPEEWLGASPGREYVWKLEQLADLDLGPQSEIRQLLGLFEPDHMEFETDRAGDTGGEPSLTEMTGRALEILGRDPDGFVLVVEGGRIDHAHHANNAHRALEDTLEMDRAVKLVLERTRAEDTLVIVTADHGHPMTLAGYARRGNPVLGLVEDNDRSGNPAGPAKDGQKRPYALLQYPIGPGYPGASDVQPEGIKRFPHKAERFETPERRHDPSEGDPQDPDTLQLAMIPRYSGSHSGEDVPVYAGGAAAALIDGVQEQHYVYHAIVEALGWNRPRATRPEKEPKAP